MLGPVPRPAALGRRGGRGRLAPAGRRDRRPRPRGAARGSGRAGGRGAGPAPPADEHVHRAGAERPVRDRPRPRSDRSAGAPRRPARRRSVSVGDSSTARTTETDMDMILATTQVEDFDRFLEIFSTKGADKRRQHGSKGVLIFRDPSEDDRVWALFDWDEDGWQSFVTDPEVPPIMREAGHKSKPVTAAFAGRCDA